jgi:hypothetical protein
MPRKTEARDRLKEALTTNGVQPAEAAKLINEGVNEELISLCIQIASYFETVEQRMTLIEEHISMLTERTNMLKDILDKILSVAKPTQSDKVH